MADEIAKTEYKASTDLLKFYSDELVKLVSSVNRNIYIVFFFILFSWIYIIEGLNIRYWRFLNEHDKEIEKLQEAIKYQNKRASTIKFFNPSRIDYKQLKESSLKNDIKDSAKFHRKSIDTLYLADIDNLIKRNVGQANTLITDQKDSLLKKIDGLRKEEKNREGMLEQKEFNEFIKDIPFPFKTIFYFTNSLKNGPEALIIIICLLLIYVYFVRLKVLKYTSRIIRIAKQDDTLKINP
jgi:hypothetical protein